MQNTLLSRHWLGVGVVGLSFSHCAFGYIDPGSGHLLLQIVMAAALGGLFYIKRIIRYVGGFFSKEG